MSDLYWLTEEPMARLEPYFPRTTANLGWMIDVPYLNAHRTTSTMRVKRGAWVADWTHEGGMNIKL